MSKKKEIKIEEMFSGMPRLKEYFKREEYIIKRYGEGNGQNPAVKSLKKRMEELLDTAVCLSQNDFEIIYYLNKCKYGEKREILHALKKVNESYEEFEEMLGIKQKQE